LIAIILVMGAFAVFLPYQPKHRLFVPVDDARLKGWLPAPGGVLVSTSMHLFYETYYSYPNVNWRFVPGFEPMIMPQKYIDAWAGLQHPSPRTIQLVLETLTPDDRLLLLKSETQPADLRGVVGVQWLNCPDYWIGRKI